jgi:hypothetical protein
MVRRPRVGQRASGCGRRLARRGVVADISAPRVFDHPGLRVSAASPEHLLAMKVLAAPPSRRRGHPVPGQAPANPRRRRASRPPIGCATTSRAGRSGARSTWRASVAPGQPATPPDAPRQARQQPRDPRPDAPPLTAFTQQRRVRPATHQHLREHGQSWQTRVARPSSRGGQTAWAAPARDDAGAEIALKVALKPETEQDVVTASLLRCLWLEPAPDGPFRPLQAMCDHWADEFEAKTEGAPVDGDRV